MKYFVRMFRLGLLAMLLATAIFSARPVTKAHALGSTITVRTSVAGVNLADGECSLEEAIVNANVDDPARSYPDCPIGTGSDTIEFTDGLGTITLDSYSNSDRRHITDPDGLTIDGGGDIVIDGAYAYRLFYIDQAPLILNNLQLVNGYSDAGGAVYNYAGNLTVTNSKFYFNKANYGGAIYNYYGSLTIANSLFLENLSNDPVIQGGAIYVNGGSVKLMNNTFRFNFAQQGGDDLYILTAGTVRLYNNIFAAPLGDSHCVVGFGVDINGLNNLFENTSAVCGFTNGVNGNILGENPAFQPGSEALSSTSPAIDAGDSSACGTDPVNNTSYNGVGRPSGYGCDIGAYEYPQTRIQERKIFYSTATRDGDILESSETSSKGGSMNKTATIFRVGDDPANRQYRTILSFNTASGFYDGGMITSVTLRLKPAGVAGTNPFKTHGNLLADVSYDLNPPLELADFQAFANKSAVVSFTKTLDPDGFYSQSLAPADFSYISPHIVTKFRLRFKLGDNNDFGADYLKIYSGDSSAENRPQLIIEYYYYIR